MSLFLQQSTAVTLRIGPFVDAADGFTPETSLTLSQSDFRLSKNGGAFAQKNDATAGTHDENGWYTCVLDATDTNTQGNLVIAVNESGARPVRVDIHVIGGTGVVANNSNVTTAGNNTVAIYNRIGAPVGASISADIAAVDTAIGGLDSAADIAEEVWESSIAVADQTTPLPARTARRSLMQLWQDNVKR